MDDRHLRVADALGINLPPAMAKELWELAAFTAVREMPDVRFAPDAPEWPDHLRSTFEAEMKRPEFNRRVREVFGLSRWSRWRRALSYQPSRSS